MGVEDVGVGGRWGAHEISKEWEKVLECEGERVCECWKDSLCKMVGGVGKFVEVEASDAGACKQWYVKESERKRRCGS